MISKRNLRIYAIGLAALLLLTSAAGCSLSSRNSLSIHMIDVGQGESILIVTPHNKTILIDAGEYREGRRVKAYLRKHRINKIDLLIGTHPHSDHIGGLAEIIHNFKVDQIVMPRTFHNSTTFENLLMAIESSHLKINSPELHKKIQFDEDIQLQFLGPLKEYGDHLNLWSIVLRLEYKNQSFLFTGDMEKEAEMDLLNFYDEKSMVANVLNIGHHGSDTSTSEGFLNTVNPEIALISAGKNNAYGHPHPEVIQRLKEHQVWIYRTDIQGNVVLFSDGYKIWSNQPPSN
ncbi:ComEC/Rec2 family competence protein [Alkaliphilus oremlandii]|uniref:Beta-lactamase domain protein n=1 Tax=Alkaliphilus oremlandii (strain OhILAs) TaxID=350688 RepID=A8MF98_ALKOO|nr:ComEC/Rec2 family competence protein [Alkaliphilus oremlandii]ABW18767.1 beta-lactamase domain protein [Alkaliphilus oremlandii OhILAs]